jgi:HK97 gp10 family phage protein
MKVNVSGIKELQRALGSYSKTKTEELRDAVNESALNVDRGAKKRVPVDTGRLRSSIHAVPANSFDSQTQTKTGDLEGAVVTNVEYAEKVEFGIRQAAQPYMFPAYEEERPEFVKNVKRILKL